VVLSKRPVSPRAGSRAAKSKSLLEAGSILAFLVFFAFSAVGSVTSSSPSPTPTEFPIPSPTATFVPVTVAPQEIDTYFALENNEILYGETANPKSPCIYYISGNVTGLNEIPFMNYIVNIKILEIDSGTPQEPIRASPDYDNAPSGWHTLFSIQPGIYELWLTLEESGEEISPHITVSLRDCDQNEAIVNFVQVKPLPNQPPYPFIATVMLTNTDAPFVVENNQITYRYRQTLGRPCYYVISGRVLDLDGEPFTDFIVNIKDIPFEEIAPVQGSGVFPGSGIEDEGASGWSFLLPQSTVDYEIWLTTGIGGEEISPHIFVQTRECDQNWAIINFVQVKALP
jgi:hypothetical protein